MSIEEFKRRYLLLAKKANIQVLEEEIIKLFLAQVVVNEYQLEQSKKCERKLKKVE